MKKSTCILLTVTMLFASNVLAASSTIFDLSKNSTKDNLQTFNCTATDVDTKVFIQNLAQLIKGFDNQGQLFITQDDLNKVYFQAYHDPKDIYDKIGGQIIAATTGNGTIKCELGEGTNRTLIKGDFG